MTEQTIIAAFADAAAAALDLDLNAECRAGVIANLTLLFERAGDFTAIPLPDDCDPAQLLRL
jgi:hypothetical protein